MIHVLYFRRMQVAVTLETLQCMAMWTLTPTLLCPLDREAILPRPLSMDHPYLQDNPSEQNIKKMHLHKYVVIKPDLFGTKEVVL